MKSAAKASAKRRDSKTTLVLEEYGLSEKSDESKLISCILNLHSELKKAKQDLADAKAKQMLAEAKVRSLKKGGHRSSKSVASW